ncbi:trans-2,3-dihydro-3-hydroxyanthranilate isomerase [Alkalihalobacillus xiaoxiensis]|uniref:Trans-2,3-dihydro-3-hydroxyanthranilate isomerase n=1 Tax=Shouchella xiaoxiensis TaxID=766895 RepID=A0ABS2SPB7_9BACI|nr:trans-2,3-dihydro-3-hydroxyanthranilate isomerase [Shouchella xiaoxiensis]
MQEKHTNSGNQLAIFLPTTELAPEKMQSIANDMQFSESLFLTEVRGKVSVRIFTPEEEIPFAGHPLIGAGFFMHQILGRQPPFTIETEAGFVILNYRRDTSTYWLEQQQPSFGEKLMKTDMANVLQLKESDFHTSLPVQEVSTGLPVIVCPLQSLAAVQKVKLQLDHYNELISRGNAKGICVFSTETINPQNDLHVRDFAPFYGISEDPATGSSNGSIASYLLHHNALNLTTFLLKSEQGYQINRPSLLYLDGKKTDNRFTVHVGGQVSFIAKGEWSLV